ncbi:hypothetical protein HN014_02085 [Aquimarina sp. TRL1]|uniref:hypothetical protein n=1 Tax=Aquimarina sp. (strain TRL1) TaxID=2736252 RepID=UPI00158D1E3F|nr:hypothetical protein [Aquimarina sp. TRL1]QKX03754.1 hypothetical protein HN014_02085 [Aquimarina sp. TRL1]
MKNIYKYLFIAISIVIITSCEDEDKNPFPANELDSSAVLRTLNIINTEVDINNISASNISIEVEADDFLNNSRFESVDVFVSFVDAFVDKDGDLTPTPDDDDDISKEDVLVRNIPASEFSAGDNGKPKKVISVAASEAIDLLGLNSEIPKIDGGDIFRIRLAIKLNNGDIYTSTNLNTNVAGGLFFNSPFRYDGNVVCGYPETFLVGKYQLEWISGVFPAFGVSQSFIDEEVEITASSGTARQIKAVTYLKEFAFSGPLNFNLICGKIILPKQDSPGGVGCGGGNIMLETDGQLNAGAFDVDGVDDSEFTMKFIDAVNDGGCGASPYEVELKFTKI